MTAASCLANAGMCKVVFVHGCFWHRHPGCRFAYTPKSNTEFWLTKLNTNMRRDAMTQQALVGADWEVLVVWECEVADLAALSRKLCLFLTGSACPSCTPRTRQENSHA